MNIDDLKLLIEKKESQTLEFKKSTSLIKPIFQTLCGFLNGYGGTVLVGVTDSGKIVGQEVTDSTKKEIANEISKIEPPVQISTTFVPVGDGKEVIVLQVHKSGYAPCVFDGRAYQRIQSATSKMPQHQYEQLLVERNHLNYAWDELLSTGCTINDLDHEEILGTIKQGIAVNRISLASKSDDIEEILNKFELSRDGHITNAAVVLFAKNVQPNYPQCQIKMARFNGKDKLGGFLDSKIIYGNAFTILHEASLFLQRHLSVASFFQENSIVRIDKPDLPVLAVREALVNAICHRDYSNRSSTITMAIYEDKLEIWSDGNLPKGITIDDLKKKHPSKQRNKLISDIIYKRGLVEKWGTGTLAMINLCKEHGVSEPTFEEYSGGFSVTFPFKKLIERPMPSDNILDKFTPRQKEIIDLLENNGPLGFKDMKLHFEESITERTLMRELKYLTENKVLEVRGQTNARIWLVLKK